MAKFDELIKARLREGATDSDVIDALIYHYKMPRVKAEYIVDAFWRKKGKASYFNNRLNK